MTLVGGVPEQSFLMSCSQEDCIVDMALVETFPKSPAKAGPERSSMETHKLMLTMIDFIDLA
jgi:hypothetical protein